MFYAIQTSFNLIAALRMLTHTFLLKSAADKLGKNPSELQPPSADIRFRFWTAMGTVLLALCDLNVVLFQLGGPLAAAGGWIWPFYLPALLCFAHAAR